MACERLIGMVLVLISVQRFMEGVSFNSLKPPILIPNSGYQYGYFNYFVTGIGRAKDADVKDRDEGIASPISEDRSLTDALCSSPIPDMKVAINVKLTIAYDGSSFLGWQKTNQGPSIEGTLQTALERILQHPVYLQAASRTDSGVMHRVRWSIFLAWMVN